MIKNWLKIKIDKKLNWYKLKILTIKNILNKNNH